MLDTVLYVGARITSVVSPLSLPLLNRLDMCVDSNDFEEMGFEGRSAEGKADQQH